MIEIEKKYRLTRERRDEILASLDEIGARFESEDLEENKIYGGEALESTG